MHRARNAPCCEETGSLCAGFGLNPRYMNRGNAIMEVFNSFLARTVSLSAVPTCSSQIAARYRICFPSADIREAIIHFTQAKKITKKKQFQPYAKKNGILQIMGVDLLKLEN